MKHLRTLSRLLIPIFFLFTSLAPAASPAVAKASVYQTGFVRWRAADNAFAGWSFKGVTVAGNGALQFDLATAAQESDPYPAGGYYSGNFYNGSSYWVGEATSPIMNTTFGFAEAIASWNADTPDGAWIETLISARFGERWTKWYNLGIWASGTDTIQRHSVRLQGDSDGYVSVDTLVLTNKKASPDGFQLKLRLFSADGVVIPTVRNASVAYSTSPVKDPTLSSGKQENWNTLLAVPECSQMVYPDGGNVWCSPTSTSMVLGYWGKLQGPCEPRVRATVAGVYDWIYDGHGNWPFNTAYAASLGMEAYVARFTSLEQAEPWVKAGVPVVMSIAWKKGELTGASVSSSNGHLIVLVGFDAKGDAIVNDPAFASNDQVQATYLRSELESIWLKASGGTVYLIFPPGHAVPSL